MFKVIREELDWGGRKLVLETGKVARQADGAVVATYGETVVLAAAVGARSPKPGIDFFPLTVNYQEKYFAAGKIPGGTHSGTPAVGDRFLTELSTDGACRRGQAPALRAARAPARSARLASATTPPPPR